MMAGSGHCTFIAVLILAAGLAACGREAPVHQVPDTEENADAVVSADVKPEGSVEAKVSRFGEYRGYSPQLYSEWVVSSRYITTRDGTGLAADIVRPARNGVAVSRPYPVLWTYSRYHRRQNGKPWIEIDPILQRLVRHGYVIVVVNVRGGGASFGRYEGLFSEAETKDAYDVIDWLSRQSWSTGSVGMFGVSYMGITQYMAASTQHPALKAIMPENGYFNFYDAIHTNGILRSDMVRHWADGVRWLDLNAKPVPVDDDLKAELAAQAVSEHEGNFDPIVPLTASPFRDSTYEGFNWSSDMPSAVMDRINEADIPIYHWGGWYDPYTRDTLLLEANYTGTDKLAMGPWPHEPATPEEAAERVRILGVESLRWYDYWLKEIDNGIMDDPRIHIAIVDTPQKSWTWTALSAFPGPSDRVAFYFTGQSSPARNLPDDRDLTPARPKGSARLRYVVDPETTTGTASRWDANDGGAVVYPDMTENDRRSLTFTSAPLSDDVTVAGSPIVTLYASSTAPDTDFYALLEEVDANGVSRYVSEGMLRASLRKTGTPPWNTIGLPWHRAYSEDRQPLTPNEIVKLKFDIYPTAHLFNKGNRIRIAIMGADRDNTEPPPAPGAEVTVYTGGDRASHVTLPIMNRPDN